MPFFKVKVVSIAEHEILVEGTNMAQATVKGLDAIRLGDMQLPKPNVHFDEVSAKKLPDLMSFDEAQVLVRAPYIVR